MPLLIVGLELLINAATVNLRTLRDRMILCHCEMDRDLKSGLGAIVWRLKASMVVSLDSEI